MLSDADLLAAYDDQIRDGFGRRVPPTWTHEVDGPLVRCRSPRDGFCLATTGIEALTSEELEGLVDRTLVAYADPPVRFEWKTYDHERADLRELLTRQGFGTEPRETLVLGEAAALAADPVLPPGLTLRTTTERADLDRVAAMESEVWGEDWGWLADDLAERLANPLEPTTVYLVEDDGEVVSAAWLVALAGTGFAGLWGGSTLPAYRGRGIYRALVAVRAQEAVRRGHPYLQVDASEDSRPILERLGLRSVGGTQPFVHDPSEQ